MGSPKPRISHQTPIDICRTLNKIRTKKKKWGKEIYGWVVVAVGTGRNWEKVGGQVPKHIVYMYESDNEQNLGEKNVSQSIPGG